MTVRTTAPSGWLMMDGGTIGDTGSGADSESATNETLFGLLWNGMADAEAPVSSGRGASAAADWAAGKTTTLPDPRGRTVIGSGTGSSLTARTHGDAGGNETHTLMVAELPSGSFQGAVGNQYSTVDDAANSLQGGSLVARVTDTTTGSGNAHTLMQPWLALNFIIKL